VAELSTPLSTRHFAAHPHGEIYGLEATRAGSRQTSRSGPPCPACSSPARTPHQRLTGALAGAAALRVGHPEGEHHRRDPQGSGPPPSAAGASHDPRSRTRAGNARARRPPRDMLARADDLAAAARSRQARKTATLLDASSRPPRFTSPRGGADGPDRYPDRVAHRPRTTSSSRTCTLPARRSAPPESLRVSSTGPAGGSSTGSGSTWRRTTAAGAPPGARDPATDHRPAPEAKLATSAPRHEPLEEVSAVPGRTARPVGHDEGEQEMEAREARGVLPQPGRVPLVPGVW